VVYWSNEKAGLKVTIDFAGNIIGKRQGTDDSLNPLIGSHIDMVPDGGDYDAVWFYSGLEIMEIENNIVTYPLQMN
jgi:N-carbamoyl-L-amino-acid hydrolase